MFLFVFSLVILNTGLVLCYFSSSYLFLFYIMYYIVSFCCGWPRYCVLAGHVIVVSESLFKIYLLKLIIHYSVFEFKMYLFLTGMNEPPVTRRLLYLIGKFM